MPTPVRKVVRYSPMSYTTVNYTTVNYTTVNYCLYPVLSDGKTYPSAGMGWKGDVWRRFAWN